MVKILVKIFAIVLLATSVYAGAAGARGGGGGAEPMPGTNFTDLPPYHPMPACRTKRSCVYYRYHRPLYNASDHRSSAAFVCGWWLCPVCGPARCWCAPCTP
jgi:hypothetical protein